MPTTCACLSTNKIPKTDDTSRHLTGSFSHPILSGMVAAHDGVASIPATDKLLTRPNRHRHSEQSESSVGTLRRTKP